MPFFVSFPQRRDPGARGDGGDPVPQEGPGEDHAQGGPRVHQPGRASRYVGHPHRGHCHLGDPLRAAGALDQSNFYFYLLLFDLGRKPDETTACVYIGDDTHACSAYPGCVKCVFLS